MKRLILNAAYFLSTSESYQAKKHFFYNFLENDKYKYKKYFDIFMITLIFMSVAILVREVKIEIPTNLQFFNNYVISMIFLIEYLLRLWVNTSISDIIIEQNEHDTILGRKFSLSTALWKVTKIEFKYITSVRAIIDLLAIVPFFHQLRLLRIFILFRVFKLFRYARSFQTFSSVLATKKFEFLTLLIFASIVVFVSSVLIYVMEANNPNSPIDTIFEAFYWSIVTISTVGYGDITPATDAGRAVAILVIIAGIAVLAFTTSIVVSAFTEKLDEIRETKIVDDVSKLKQCYLICGYGNVAQEVAKNLVKDYDVIVLDKDPAKIKKAKNDNLVALNYDPGSVESYKNLRININTQVKAILCLTENDVENVYTALTVRSINEDVYILSILLNNMHRNKLTFAGVNEILYSKELVGMIAKEFIGQPVAFEAIHTLTSDTLSTDVEEIFINERILENFATVQELNNAKYRIILLGIHKKESNRFFFNPIDSTILEQGDYLLVIGNSVFIKEFGKYLYKKVAS